MATDHDISIPPASFGFLVESLLMQAQMQLGLLKFGQGSDDEQEPNLPIARHSIDLLGVLQEKTRGNLSLEEQRLLENGLTELRFRYVQVADEQKRKSSSPTLTTPAPESDKAAEEGPRIITADGGKGTKSA